MTDKTAGINYRLDDTNTSYELHNLKNILYCIKLYKNLKINKYMKRVRKLFIFGMAPLE